MNFSGWKSASRASARRSSWASDAVRPTSPVSIPAQLHLVERPIEGLRDCRLEQPFPQPDPQLAGEHLHDVLRRQRIASFEERPEDRAFPRGSRGRLDGGVRLGDLERASARRRRHPVRPARVSTSATARPRSDERSYAAPSAPAGRPGDRRDHGRDRGPAEARCPLIRLGEGSPRQEDGRDSEILRIERPEVRREEAGLLGCPGGRRYPFGQLAPAMHGGDGIPSPSMTPRTTYSDRLVGRLVTLRRHAPGNLATFKRWYSDPEVARLTRYQDGPMRPDEIERFFTARVLGADTFTMAIHERATDRLIGTCAFSQLDGDNGSALFHITIGEKEAWGRGFGTEATRLMLDHAFGRLGLHRVGLSVFSFNERAIRSYLKAGFTIEGRARDAIWRGGKFWDEISMSVLESEWRRAHPAARPKAGIGASGAGAAGGRAALRGN